MFKYIWKKKEANFGEPEDFGWWDKKELEEFLEKHG